MSDKICKVRIDDPHWPERTPALIDRDRRLYPVMVGDLLDAEPSDTSDAPPPLIHDQLLEALAIDDIIRAGAAAFVAGRCTTSDSTVDQETLAALDVLIDSFDPKRLRSRATVYVEALMSSALLGRLDRARESLTVLVTDPDHNSIGGYLAASYLAQLGSAAGYPILHADLHDRDDANARMLAVRNLLPFLAYDGQQVGGLTVDVTAEFLQRMRDGDIDVAVEVPELIAEANLPGLEGILADATKRPYAKGVRKAAEWVIDELAKRAKSGGH